MPRLTKSLRPDRLNAAKAFITRVVQTRFDGNASAAARTLGISQAMLSEVLSGSRGPGVNVLEAVADLEGVPLDDVIGRKVPRRAESGVLPVVRAEDDPSTERAAAVAFARANGLPDEAVRLVQALPVRTLSPEQWYARIKVAAEELEPASASAPPQTLRRDVR